MYNECPLGGSYNFKVRKNTFRKIKGTTIIDDTNQTNQNIPGLKSSRGNEESLPEGPRETGPKLDLTNERCGLQVTRTLKERDSLKKREKKQR